MTTRAISLSLVFALLALGSAMSDGAAADTKVAVAHPVVREVTDAQDFIGRVEAIQSVELRARVTGHIARVAFKPGRKSSAATCCSRSIRVSSRPS